MTADSRPPSVRIRPATVDDLADLLDMIERYWSFENLPGFDARRLDPPLKRLLSDPGLGGGWIARAGGEAVGYLLAVYVFSLEHFGLTAEVDELFVLSGHRGSGIGSALLQAAESAAAGAGCTNMSLRLGWDNDKARAFYGRHGFRERSGYRLLEKELEFDTRRDPL